MNDDALDRALFALPLEEPPAGLHAAILAATVYRPVTAVRAWEVWLLGTAVAVAVWLAGLFIAVPQSGAALADALVNLLRVNGPVVSIGNLWWVAIGGAAALWISQLSLPVTVNAPRPR